MIVKRFDVLEHAQAGCGQVLEVFVLGPLVLERPEEPFHHGVVVARAAAVHRTLRCRASSKSAGKPRWCTAIRDRCGARVLGPSAGAIQ